MDAEKGKGVQSALDRLRKKKEFSCIECANWIASVGDGLHDTCTEEWKTFEEYGLCYDCFTKQKDLDAARERFQGLTDDFWDAANDDSDEKQHGGSN